MRGSRDRGCKGHRILRRVLVDGRHLGTSRAIGFHESMVEAEADEGRAKAPPEFAERERGRRDRGVRGSIGAGAVGRNAHALVIKRTGDGEWRRGAKKAARVWLRSAEAFTSAVKHSVPR
jgi:hypothetical protein